MPKFPTAFVEARRVLPRLPCGAGRSHAMTFVLGLTGSIGMGKTAVSSTRHSCTRRHGRFSQQLPPCPTPLACADMLRDLGIPVLDADQARGVRAVALLRDARRLQCVHDLYASGGAAVPIVGEAFPGVVVDGRVDRQALSSRVVGSGNEDAMRLLEHLVHPLVAERRAQFVAAATASGAPLAVLDVPLLFETGLDAQCDAVAVVSADTATQRSRVLQRAGMTAVSPAVQTYRTKP